MTKIVLAYSGGLDTSVAIPWLKDKGYDVVAAVLDVGQAGKNLKEIQEKALQVGAVESYVIDGKEEFAKDFVGPVIQANALYEGKYPLVSALSRPLIIKKLVELAHQTGAKAIAHGSTGKGNDQVRFETAIHALDPSLESKRPSVTFIGRGKKKSTMRRNTAFLSPSGKSRPIPSMITYGAAPMKRAFWRIHGMKRQKMPLR